MCGGFFVIQQGGILRKLVTLSLVIFSLIAITTNTAQAGQTYRNPPKYLKEALKDTFGSQWQLASKVAYCESGYNLKAVNTSSTGLFQIDAPGGGRTLNGKWFSRNYLFTLQGNLQAAKILWAGSGKNFYPHWRWSYHCWG